MNKKIDAIYDPNTVIKLDGKIATTCSNNMWGVGIKYGEHYFNVNEENIGFDCEALPKPDFVIKDPDKHNIEIVKIREIEKVMGE